MVEVFYLLYSVKVLEKQSVQYFDSSFTRIGLKRSIVENCKKQPNNSLYKMTDVNPVSRNKASMDLIVIKIITNVLRSTTTLLLTTRSRAEPLVSKLIIDTQQQFTAQLKAQRIMKNINVAFVP